MHLTRISSSPIFVFLHIINQLAIAMWLPYTHSFFIPLIFTLLFNISVWCLHLKLWQRIPNLLIWKMLKCSYGLIKYIWNGPNYALESSSIAIVKYIWLVDSSKLFRVKNMLQSTHFWEHNNMSQLKNAEINIDKLVCLQSGHCVRWYKYFYMDCDSSWIPSLNSGNSIDSLD